MECTFLLGKTPASKRKKQPHPGVEILEARLENIESTYSERISHMESILSKVIPTGQENEEGSSSPTSDAAAANTTHDTTTTTTATTTTPTTTPTTPTTATTTTNKRKQSNRVMKGAGINTNVPIDIPPASDDGWMDVNSPLDKVSLFDAQWDRNFGTPAMNVDPASTPTLSLRKAGATGIETPLLPFLKEEPDPLPLFTPDHQ
ncbi:hypothetical protein BX616_002934, partial [Lobosporangium transversale]